MKKLEEIFDKYGAIAVIIMMISASTYAINNLWEPTHANVVEDDKAIYEKWKRDNPK